ncbi:MAG: hypothetical protein K0S18_126 [Anaerocolumna sp.]|nr:hypothetical protein [Anaerocolumna sp.]
MKVSKDIQYKMHKAARLHSEANKLMEDVNDYFEKNGIDEDVLRCGNGISLEEVELGNDIVDEFVSWAENDFEL